MRAPGLGGRRWCRQHHRMPIFYVPDRSISRTSLRREKSRSARELQARSSLPPPRFIFENGGRSYCNSPLPPPRGLEASQISFIS